MPLNKIFLDHNNEIDLCFSVVFGWKLDDENLGQPFFEKKILSHQTIFINTNKNINCQSYKYL
jgi:hypothetical protein